MQSSKCKHVFVSKMTSPVFLNIMMGLSLIGALVTCVSGEDDFKIFDIENELGSYTDGYWDNRKKVVGALTNLNGTIVSYDDVLWFTCTGGIGSQFTDTFPPFKKEVYPKILALRNCVLPTKPLSEVLKEYKINVNGIETLQLAFTDAEVLPLADYMEGLNIHTLFIDLSFSTDIFDNNPDFLKPLSNLTTLIVWGTRLPIIPDNVHLEAVSLRHEGNTSVWENCENIKVLSLSGLSGHWPETCSKLTQLRFEGLHGLRFLISHKLLLSGIAQASHNLETLFMQNCDMSNPPYEIINGAENLQHLNLTGNRITDDTFVQFPNLAKLKRLDLSNNFLNGSFLFELVKKLPSLEYLRLDKNQLVNFLCDLGNKKDEFTSNMKSLRHLSLVEVPITLDCLQKLHFSRLQYLNLASSEKIEELNLRNLPTTDARYLEVDMRGRNITQIYFTEDDYLALDKEEFSRLWGTINERHTRPHLTVLLTTIDCSCQNYWIWLALKKYPDVVTLPGLKCEESGNDFLKEPYEEFNCQGNIDDDVYYDDDDGGNDGEASNLFRPWWPLRVLINLAQVRSKMANRSVHEIDNEENDFKIDNGNIINVIKHRNVTENDEITSKNETLDIFDTGKETKNEIKNNENPSEDKTTVVECHNKGCLHNRRYNQYEIVGFNISDNVVFSLEHISIPQSVKWIDLRGNHLYRLTLNETARLFAVKERQVWLSRNPISCDCNNKKFLHALEKHRHQIMDFDALTCANSKDPLPSPDDMCPRFYIPKGVRACIIILSLLVFLGIGYRFRSQWCIRKEDSVLHVTTQRANVTGDSQSLQDLTSNMQNHQG